MRARNIIKIAALAIAVAGIFLAFNSFGRLTSKENSKKEATENPPKQKGKGRMGWEGLSRQFF
ncbi:MAG: hypothetical protein WDN26_22830 [Chitinophagaceae bacterium]